MSFGCGSFGDMGSYSFAGVFKILDLTPPLSVEACASESYEEISLTAVHFLRCVVGQILRVRAAVALLTVGTGVRVGFAARMQEKPAVFLQWVRQMRMR